MSTIRVIRLDHVQLAAPQDSENALRAFYSGLFGLPEIEKPAPLHARGGVWFDCGNMQLHIGIDRDPPPINAPSRRHPAFEVADLNAARAALVAANCPIEEDNAPLPGVTRFYTRDPAGNRVELLEYHQARQ